LQKSFKMENNKNEIDLLELLIKIYLYLKKYWWILIISVFAGIIFTFIKNKSSVKSYNSSMIVYAKQNDNYMYAVTFKEFSKRYEKNPAEVITGVINQANELIKSNNLDILARKMNLKAEDLKGLKVISSFYKTEKGEAHGNIVKINATSSNQDVYNNLGNGIEYLINNNAYVKSQISEDSLMLINIIQKIDIKSKELDSMQSKFLKNGKFNDLIIFKDNSFFGESVMLVSLKEKLIKKLQNLNQVKIVEDFFVPKSKTVNIKTALIINSLIFIFLGIFIIFFVVFNKKAKAFNQNRKKS